MMNARKLLALVALASPALCAAEWKEGPLTNQAREFGSTACLQEVRAIDKFLNEKAGANGAWSTAPKDNPARRMYGALNVRAFDDGTWGYDAITVNPAQQGCDGSLVRIITFPNTSCSSVRETVYSDYKYMGDLAGKAIYENGSVKAVLEELTGSCIAIRYEALFPVPK